MVILHLQNDGTYGRRILASPEPINLRQLIHQLLLFSIVFSQHLTNVKVRLIFGMSSVYARPIATVFLVSDFE